jgi:hypothetical protein
MADRFEVQTRTGVRNVEFVPDMFGQRGVRVLVDDKRVASIPFPHDGSPHEEVPFPVDDQWFVAVAQLASASGPMDSSGLRYDIFSNGLSLIDGSKLSSARFRAPALGDRYPGVFRFIDGILRIAPVAALPGIVIGVTRAAGDLSSAARIALIALLVGAVLFGTRLASQMWQRIRTRDELRVPSRAVLGFMAVLGSYAVTFVTVIAIVVTMLNTGFIGQSVCGDARAAAEADGGVGRPSGRLLLDEPGPEFTLVWQGPMTLEESAWTRVDTETLPQLRAAGFESAYARQWIRDDGTTLGTDVFAFATAEGAQSYHLAVTDYACRYSSESFAVPGGGVGLRINYGSGDPVRDQVAWIDGNRRVVIAIGYRDDSGDHREILEFVARARTSASRAP